MKEVERGERRVDVGGSSVVGVKVDDGGMVVVGREVDNGGLIVFGAEVDDGGWTVVGGDDNDSMLVVVRGEDDNGGTNGFESGSNAGCLRFGGARLVRCKTWPFGRISLTKKSVYLNKSHKVEQKNFLNGDRKCHLCFSTPEKP